MISERVGAASNRCATPVSSTCLRRLQPRSRTVPDASAEAPPSSKRPRVLRRVDTRRCSCRPAFGRRPPPLSVQTSQETGTENPSPTTALTSTSVASASRTASGSRSACRQNTTLVCDGGMDAGGASSSILDSQLGADEGHDMGRTGTRMRAWPTGRRIYPCTTTGSGWAGTGSSTMSARPRGSGCCRRAMPAAVDACARALVGDMSLTRTRRSAARHRPGLQITSA
jgi:hypothetical protein